MGPLWDLIDRVNTGGVVATLVYGLLIALLVGTVHTRGRS
jgi:hypothetical protein